MDNRFKAIAQLAGQDADIVVVWLYGSRAKGNAHASSDYDPGVAFKHFKEDDPLEKRLRLECLAIDRQNMRNALVHDYLPVDQELLHSVLPDRSYEFCIDFIAKAKETLKSRTRPDRDIACCRRSNPSPSKNAFRWSSSKKARSTSKTARLS